MQFDDKDTDWAVSTCDIVYAPVSDRLYTVVAVSVDTIYEKMVTYTRLGGSGVCYTMSIDKFKDGRFVKVEGWQLEQALAKYIGAIKNAANEENV